MDTNEIDCESVDWIQLASSKEKQRALVDTVMYLQDPYKAWNFFTS